MGARGPAPKRADQRHGHRSEADQDAITKASAGEVEIPEPDKNWHPIAKRWFAGLAKSGQSVFYEQSDWDFAYLVAESLSRDLKPQVIGMNPETGKPVRATIPLKGASLSAYLKAFTDLLMTETARRRAGVELERTGKGDSEEAGDVSWIDDARRRLRGTGSD